MVLARTRTAPQTPHDPRPALARLFTDLRREHGFEPLEVEGRIPAALAGTLYRNGPARFGNADGRYGHWFDGDGAISAIRLDGGRAFGAVRHVASWHLDGERTSGRTSTLGFATRSGGRLSQLWSVLTGRARNPANTSVMWWDDRLLALYEVGRPTEIDPRTLETIGVTDLDGALSSPLSAHPSTAPDGTVYNFGVQVGRVTTLSLYRMGARVERVRRIPLDGHPPFVHDFAVTQRYAVFFVAPLEMDTTAVLFGAKTPLDAISWRPERGTEVIVVPLDATEPVRRFTTEAFYQWHFANAYEEGGALVVDFVRYDDFATNDYLSALFEVRVPSVAADGVLVRRRIDPMTGATTEEVLFDGSCEFPQIPLGDCGRAYEHVYLAAHSAARTRSGFDAIVRVDVNRGEAVHYDVGPADFVSEPIYADGYLLAHVYDHVAGRTNLTILDAARPDDAPVARCWFDQPLPPTFHGIWRAAVAS